MRQLFLIFIGMGTGQILSVATMEGSVRAWIALGFIVAGMVFYFIDRYQEDKRYMKLLNRSQK